MGSNLGYIIQSVKFFLTPGSTADVEGLRYFDFDFPPGSRVYGDKAYNHYEIAIPITIGVRAVIPIVGAKQSQPS